jgi:two-component system NtrC family sensor kinase
MKKMLGLQLIIAVALASVTILGTFAYFVVRGERRAMIAQIEANAIQLSETIKSATRHAMLVNHRENVHRIIDTIGSQEGIDRVLIFNKEGFIIYSPDSALEGTMVDKQAEACFVCHAAGAPLERLSQEDRTRIFHGPDGDRQLGVVSPIYNDRSCWSSDCHAHSREQSVLGVLDVTMSLSRVDREIARNGRRTLGSMVTAILGISTIIWCFFHFLVGRPVNQLLLATGHVSEGDLSHRLSVRRNDEIGHLAESFNEMTQKLAEAQAQIYQSSKLASLGRLAAGVAHEINNPLTGVLTYSSFLLKRTEDPEIREDLETIVRETKRCRGIVHGLLDFSRQAPVNKLAVDINTVIERSIEIVDNQLRVGNVSATTTLQEDLPPVTADPNQLTQVLINLLVNSADAIGEGGGDIFVSTSVDDDDESPTVVIKVSDTGGGITDEHLPQVFEPFFTTKGNKGTGLGLAVVWGIIKEHGGDIRVDSKETLGTTFTIRLPASAGTERMSNEE